MHIKKFMLTVLIMLPVVFAENKNHKKRQIYREQVLPHAGGRIPDTAFQTDRLFLNGLQKEGIAVPDGVVHEQRNPQVYPFLSKPSRPVYRVALSSDARYTPEEGRYRYKDVPSVETTYLYPQIFGQDLRVPPNTPIYPVYKKTLLPNPQLNQVQFQPKKKTHILNLAPATTHGRKHHPSFKTEAYQNFNIFNTPVAPSAPGPRTNGYHYLPEYESSHFFNDFDDLFNNFDLHESSTRYNPRFNQYPLQQHLRY